MLGLIEVTGTGLIFFGGLIALILQDTPQLRRYAPIPIVAFIEGIVIAYILDDLSLAERSYGDKIATISFVVFAILQLFSMIRDWLNSRNERLEKYKKYLEELKEVD